MIILKPNFWVSILRASWATQTEIHYDQEGGKVISSQLAANSRALINYLYSAEPLSGNNNS